MPEQRIRLDDWTAIERMIVAQAETFRLTEPAQVAAITRHMLTLAALWRLESTHGPERVALTNACLLLAGIGNA